MELLLDLQIDSVMARYSEEERDTHLELWRESGLSKQAYSKASGLNYKTFLKWSKSSIGSSLVSHWASRYMVLRNRVVI